MLYIWYMIYDMYDIYFVPHIKRDWVNCIVKGYPLFSRLLNKQAYISMSACRHDIQTWRTDWTWVHYYELGCVHWNMCFMTHTWYVMFCTCFTLGSQGIDKIVSKNLSHFLITVSCNESILNRTCFTLKNIVDCLI